MIELKLTSNFFLDDLPCNIPHALTEGYKTWTSSKAWSINILLFNEIALKQCWIIFPSMDECKLWGYTSVLLQSIDCCSQKTYMVCRKNQQLKQTSTRLPVLLSVLSTAKGRLSTILLATTTPNKIFFGALSNSFFFWKHIHTTQNMNNKMQNHVLTVTGWRKRNWRISSWQIVNNKVGKCVEKKYWTLAHY